MLNSLDFLQNSNLKTPWSIAFRTLVLREEEPSRNLKCAELRSNTMSHNTERTIHGNICQQVLYTDTPDIMKPTKLTTMNKDLDSLC